MIAAVPDINILVSALLSQHGPPGRIQAAWERGEVLFILSQPMLAKADDVLHRPYIFDAFSTPAIAEDRVQRVLTLLNRKALITPHVLDLKVVKEDPEDDTIIIAAVEGNADCIISGDKHLKDLGSYKNIPILTPAQFVEQYHISE